jgi:kynurenine formamidase
VHVEWLVNLDALVGRGEFTFWALPIKWVGMTGSQVRAVAELRGG